MSIRDLDQTYVINELMARVSLLTNETIVQAAYIKQLEEKLAKDGEKVVKTDPSDEV